MFKRVIAVLLCLCLCLAFIPAKSSAAMTTDQYKERYRIMRQIRNMYKDILEQSEQESLKGFCGMMVSWQLYFLGINDTVIGNNGNEFYDHYKDMTQTTGGFAVHVYPAEDYSMEEALYTITKGGTEDVYNIIVGFEKTATDAGKLFGHVCMIHAIIDGYVYFVEGFDVFEFPEGEPVVMDITSFANYWKGWATYEGAIYFGNQQGEDYANYYGTDMYVQTTAPTVVRSAPSQETLELRKTLAGERLHAVGLYQTREGSWYYKVVEHDGYGFVPAGSVESIWMGFEDIRTTSLRLPEKLTQGQKFGVTGKIRVPLLQLESLWITITDAEGNILKDQTIDKNGKFCNLGQEETVSIRDLPEGCYSYNIYADVRNHYVHDGALDYKSKTVPVKLQSFTVGKAKKADVAPPEEEQEPESGWVLKEGTWYYMEEGQPRTGWFCSGGVNYYLKEDGSVTTGWAEVGGEKRFFSDTGALRMGWLVDDEQSYYLLRNGVPATGWKIVDGDRYFLGDDGVLRKNGWLQLEDKLYYLDEDGKTCSGWVEMKEGKFNFHEDGYLLSRMVKEEEVEYDGKWKPKKFLK